MRTGLVQQTNTQSGNARKGLRFRSFDANGGGTIHRYSDGLEVYVPPKHAGLTVRHVEAMNDGGLQRETAGNGPLGRSPSAYIKALDTIKPPAAKYSGSSPVHNQRKRA